MDKIWKGTGVALVTPFDNNLAVDYAALRKLIEHVTEGGVDYLVVMGTTGESPTLTAEERLEILRFVKENNSKNLPIVYGMGGNNTAAVVAEYKDFDEAVDAFLVVCPYYNKPPQKGLLLHYEAIADVSPSPIILYNVPGRTSVNLSVDTTLRLAEHPNVTGIKEAVGDNVKQCIEIAKHMPTDFSLISGDDDLIIPFMQSGGHGVISVIANGLPHLTSRLINQCLEGDYDRAEQTNQEIGPLIKMIFEEGNPAGIKVLLKLLEMGSDHLRLPLVSASDQLAREMMVALKKLRK